MCQFQGLARCSSEERSKDKTSDILDSINSRMRISIHIFCLCLLAFLRCKSWASKRQGLSNKHVKIVAVPWSPFLEWKCGEDPDFFWSEAMFTDCPNGDERLYRGILWELLRFMQQGKHFTFELMGIDDAFWGGTCYDNDNCTGIVGRVNRREADIGLGKKCIY